MPKRSIRSQLLAQRKSQSADDCLKLSDRIQQQFIDSGCLRDATCVALYSPINNEVHTGRLADYVLTSGKKLTYPRVQGGELTFLQVSGHEQLTTGAFGVLEPRGSEHVPLDALDVVVVPGVAFDQDGHRLGYGRGYYDRTLAACREDCKKVGLAYEMQLVEKLPTLEHDQVLSMLITESRTLVFPAAVSSTLT